MMCPRSFRGSSFRLPFAPSTQNRLKRASAVMVAAVLSVLPCFAQEQQDPAQQSQMTDSQSNQTQAATPAVTIPGGSSVALVLTHPIQSRHLHRGDDVYAQVTSPVTVGNEVVIPPGTFVQGTVDKLEQKSGRGELRLQSMAITFPDGYTVPIPGPLILESADGYAFKDPGQNRTVAAFALPAAGLGLGALIGHVAANPQSNTITSSIPPGCTGPPPGCVSSSLTTPGSSAKSTAIGAVVGGAIGGIASIALLVSSHNFFLDVGSPMEMTLQGPVSLKEDEVSRAVEQSEKHPVAEQPIAPLPTPPPPPPPPVDHGTCYTPGTPGTPPQVIPGPPNADGTPGPPTIIPGTPATPGTPYPCP